MRRFPLLFLLLPVLLLTIASAQTPNQPTFQLLRSLCDNSNCVLGNSPYGSFIQAADGNLYHTFYLGGGPPGAGTVLRLTPPTVAPPLGTPSVLYTFCSLADCADGASPDASLTQGSDGNLYGTTSYAGDPTASGGTLFKLTPSGVYTVLYTFCANETRQSCPGGFAVGEPLTEGTDGNFYGVATAGAIDTCYGGDGCGTVFKITPAGQFTTLYQFCSNYNGTLCLDGYNPPSGLIQGSDGKFYGATSQGGAYNGGTVFSITADGKLTTLHSFCSDGRPCQMDGDDPSGRLVEGKDGNFYGATAYGGDSYDQNGTLFRITPAGEFTTIYTFCYDSVNPCLDGSVPNGDLFLGGDGNFYGATSYGGPRGGGTTFEFSYSGTLTNLYSFCTIKSCLDGAYPLPPFEASDGNLYSAAEGGGIGRVGTLFDLAFPTPLPPPVQLTLSQSSVSPGTPVTLGWKVLNAFSQTMQQCYAFMQNAATGAGDWTGRQTGTLANEVYSGSTTLTPTASGTYTYALTCGGIESGFATIDVTGSLDKTSTTTLSISPNPAVLGDFLTVTVTVTASPGAPTGTPTGSVSVYDGKKLLGTETLYAGTVSMVQPTTLHEPAGTYYLTAKYLGDANNNPSTGTLTFVVTAPTANVAKAATPRAAQSPEKSPGNSLAQSAPLVSP
jgi:uncharacterized repeat protein (TIGR03803 family)